ncbi:MAG: glycosyltransferase [Akkermansia sp.]|nr:glycosyltransferase [Akkermansia sp.]
MKVLYFSGVDLSKNHTGCGWIPGLLSAMKLNQPEVRLAVSYVSESWAADFVREEVEHYPLEKEKRLLCRIRNFVAPQYAESEVLRQMVEVVRRAQPDIIHVFGSETIFGLIGAYVDIPVVVHLQGLMNPYMNAYFPPGVSAKSLSNWKEKRTYRVNLYYAQRERRVFAACRYYMGRTEWDQSVTSILSPSSRYYHCEEMLRSSFYNHQPQENKHAEGMKIISVLSSPLYKGHDLIIKTARLLKSHTDIPFEWHVFGADNFDFFQNLTGQDVRQLGIIIRGRVGEQELIRELDSADVMVHPSYIDNSPNAVCEAQLLGKPVIACHTGGLSTLIKHEETGFLVPANDPYMVVAQLQKLRQNSELLVRISGQGRMAAQKRHDRKSICASLVVIYQDIINEVALRK